MAASLSEQFQGLLVGSLVHPEDAALLRVQHLRDRLVGEDHELLDQFSGRRGTADPCTHWHPVFVNHVLRLPPAEIQLSTPRRPNPEPAREIVSGLYQIRTLEGSITAQERVDGLVGEPGVADDGAPESPVAPGLAFGGYLHLNRYGGPL